jgi:hypothetical protein
MTFRALTTSLHTGTLMIYELRTYQLVVGALPEFLECVAEERLPILADHGLGPLGFWYTEIGSLNEVVHLWAHKDLNERQERWTSGALDPRTAKLLGKLGPMIPHMNTKILSPEKCSTMK